MFETAYEAKADLHKKKDSSQPIHRKLEVMDLLEKKTPPCPNGCGIGGIHRIMENRFHGFKEMAGPAVRHGSETRVYLFVCENCVERFCIRIQKLFEPEAASRFAHSNN